MEATLEKLHPKYCDPSKTLRHISPVTFKIELSHPMLAKGIYDTFHASRLQPYKADSYELKNSHNLQLSLKMEAKNTKLISFLTEIRKRKNILLS